jgi:acyl-homoserine lactone acylase PvdQ
VLVGLGALLLGAVPGASAQAPGPLSVPALGQFRSVLAQGEGQTINALDLAAYEAPGGTAPSSFTNQQPLYVGIMPRAASLTPADLNTFYKPTDFGSLPGGTGTSYSPRAGVQVIRDARFGMAHIYGATRRDLMFGAGYATAEERLFLMDALRRTAKGTLAGLVGASAASGDASQLTDQDFSDAELTAQFEALPQRLGPEGARAHQDVLDYIAGINQRISEDNTDPTKLPAEYPALGTRPAPWTVSDTVALAVLLVTQFTVSNGSEEVNAYLQQAFQRRFGKRWPAPYQDLREAQDPEAFTVAKTYFPSDNTGRLRSGLNTVPDFGSVKARNTEVAGPDAGKGSAARAAPPEWVRSVESLRRALPPVESNAVMVAGRLSSDGKPLAAMGPQVGYYSPQIFSEYELHGGGIDVAGVSFPGASPYPLIGHGIDFAWSGTSANGDNQDTFVETLCNADGSPPTASSTGYRYHGVCRPFVTRDQTLTTPLSPTDTSSAPQTITYRTLRSVHGPVFAYATVGGRPVALTKAKGVDFHELDAVVPFMRLAENQPTDARSFMNTMGMFPGTENWFYVDDRHVAFQQSGVYPRHPAGSNVELPWWGDGRADWQGFDPATYTFSTISPTHRPRALDPPQGFIVSWNNKEAPGWRKGPSEWGDGPVHHAMLLQHRLVNEITAHGGKVDLTGLTRAVNLAATTDLRPEEDYPWMRRVIGRASGDQEKMLSLLDDWQRAGGQRLAPEGSNVYDHSAAVALMDAWWPLAVRAVFQPALGKELFDTVERRVLSLGGFGWSWASHMQKDMRSVLGAPERGRYSRVYCGGPLREPIRRRRLARVRRKCRTRLLASLDQAVAAVKTKLGPDPSAWKVPATCPKTTPASCDQKVPVTGGAVATPPFPWQNRGTYHQVVELNGRRGG